MEVRSNTRDYLSREENIRNCWPTKLKESSVFTDLAHASCSECLAHLRQERFKVLHQG